MGKQEEYLPKDYDKKYRMRDEYYKAISRGDKETIKMIEKSGVLLQDGEKDRVSDYYREIFGYNKNQTRYSKRYGMVEDLDIYTKQKDHLDEVKEFEIMRDGVKNVARFRKTKYGLFQKEKEPQTEFYIYVEVTHTGVRSVITGDDTLWLEMYCTTSREEIVKIQKYLKKLNYDVTGHNIIKELFYNKRQDNINIVTKAFVEIVNRAMDREGGFGTRKMFSRHLSLQKYIEKRCREIYRLEAFWWELRSKKMNTICNPDKAERKKQYDIFTDNARMCLAELHLRGDGAIDRASHEVDMAIKMLVDAGLVAEWRQEIVKGSSSRIWHGITPKGWKLVESVVKSRESKHITKMKDVEEINKLVNKEIEKLDKEKYSTEYDKEYRRNVKSKHSFVMK